MYSHPHTHTDGKRDRHADGDEYSIVDKRNYNKMFDKEERIFLEPGINFTLRWIISILRNRVRWKNKHKCGVYG